jgi:hypothetical protein
MQVRSNQGDGEGRKSGGRRECIAREEARERASERLRAAAGKGECGRDRRRGRTDWCMRERR